MQFTNEEVEYFKLDINFEPIGSAGSLEYISGGGIIKGFNLFKNAKLAGWIKGLSSGEKAAKGGSELFGKEIIVATTRMGRDGIAVEIIFKDGSKMDINATRIKQWIPQTNPNASFGTLDRIRFNDLREARGFKRPPTQRE